MKRHDEDKMLSFYQQWLESGQSKTRFAHTQGIIPTIFYYWVKKFQLIIGLRNFSASNASLPFPQASTR